MLRKREEEVIAEVDVRHSYSVNKIQMFIGGKRKGEGTAGESDLHKTQLLVGKTHNQ